MATSQTDQAPGAARRLGRSEAEAAALLSARPAQRAPTSRSYASIVRANVLTVFNLILAVFGVLTLVFADWRDALFLGILVANSGIGIAQEIRAKRALDRLAALVAPTARVVRDGRERTVAVEEVVEGDLLRVGAGDQVVADGRLVAADGALLDESVLTGESEPVARTAGESIRSGAFVVEGAGEYLVSAVGNASYAQRLMGEARGFRHGRSPLEQALNRLLLALVGVMVPLGVVFGVTLWRRDLPVSESISTATAGVVALVPEGLILLASLTYAVAALRIARRGALAQQLSAIESLASADVVCVDKTGTITEAESRVVEHLPEPGVSHERLEEAVRRMGAAWPSPNATMRALVAAFPADAPHEIGLRVPFASRTRWSGAEVDGEHIVVCAPELLPATGLREVVAARTEAGRRVIAVARAPGLGTDHELPADLEPLGIVVLAERLRPEAADTIAYLAREGVQVVVLSGDAPHTVAAIARDVGIPVQAIADGGALPAEQAALRELVLASRAVGRISPEGKQRVVEALQAGGHHVAMLGDGVNDVPALKAADLGIAQGSGAQIARAVGDLILVSGSFASVPAMIAEGRTILRNLQRVARLFVAKSALAAFLILTVGLVPTSYPFLPRHLSLASALTIGIPAFFLALAASTGPWAIAGFLRGVTRFAIPAGVAAGLGVVSSYLFSLNTVGQPVAEARTVAVTALVAIGLGLVLMLETPEGGRPPVRALALCAAMAVAYVLSLAIGPVRRFYELGAIDLGGVASAAAGTALALGGLWLSDERFRLWSRRPATGGPT